MDWTRKVNPVSGAGGDLEADKSGDVSQKTRGPAGRDPGQPRVRANPSQNPFGKMLERTIQNLTPALPPQICAARSRAPARHRAGARLRHGKRLAISRRSPLFDSGLERNPKSSMMASLRPRLAQRSFWGGAECMAEHCTAFICATTSS